MTYHASLHGGAMGKIIVNLIVCALAFPIVSAVASLMRFAWSDAFVANRTFTEYLGFIAGNTLLSWAYYFIYFFAVGIGLPALLRTNRPVVWAACFGLAYSLYRWIAFADIIFVPSTSVYVSIAGDHVMPVLGCVIGAMLGGRLRGKSLAADSATFG